MRYEVLETDFSDFIEYLKNEEVQLDAFSDEIIPKFKKMHKIIYSNLLINKRIVFRNPSKEYFDEILSDYIQIVPLLSRGYNKICVYLLRDIIENCLKYIYYHDHPVEYSWLEKDETFYISTSDLLKYIDKHPILLQHKKKLEIGSKLKDKYFYLSKHIHSRNRNYMHLWKCLKSIKYDDDFINTYHDDFIEISNLILMLLILFNIDSFRKMDINEKRIILDSLKRDNKRYIQSL